MVGHCEYNGVEVSRNHPIWEICNLISLVSFIGFCIFEVYLLFFIEEILAYFSF